MAHLSAATLYRFLSVLDSGIALCMVFPLAVMYFRGIWDIIDYYVLPGRAPVRYWMDLGIAHLQFIGLLLLPYMDSHLDRTKSIKFWMVSRLFMFLNNIPYMFYWHGVWLLTDHYFGTEWQDSLVALVVIWVLMCVLGSCRAAMWPPFFIAVDTQPDSLTVITRFKSKLQSGRIKDYFSDVYLSHFIIPGLAICSWRSTWNILDSLISPDDAAAADIISAKVGFIGSATMLALQWPLGQVSIKLGNSGCPGMKVLWENIVYTVTFVFLCFTWHAGWRLNVRYVITELPLGAWVNFAVGSIGLLGMQTFTEVCNIGISEDGADPGGEALYPVKYLRLFFEGHQKPAVINVSKIDDLNAGTNGVLRESAL